MATSISDVDEQLRKQQLDEALFHTQGQAGCTGFRGGSPAVRGMAAARSMRTQRVTRTPGTASAPNPPGSAPERNMTRKLPQGRREGRQPGNSRCAGRPATVDAAPDFQNAAEYCNLSALIKHRNEQQQFMHRASSSQQQRQALQRHEANIVSEVMSSSVGEVSHGPRPIANRSLRSTADSPREQVPVPRYYNTWGFSPSMGRQSNSDPNIVSRASAGVGTPPGTPTRNLRKLPNEPATTSPSSRLHTTSLGSFHQRYINQPSSAEVLSDDRRVSTAPFGAGLEQPQPWRGSVMEGIAQRMRSPANVSLFGDGKLGMGSLSSSPARRRSLGDVGTSTPMVLQVPFVDAGSPKQSGKQYVDENPFASVIPGYGTHGQKESLNLRLPVAAAGSPGASDMISNLYRQLNSVRDGPRLSGDNFFELSLQQQQRGTNVPSSQTMLEMLIGSQAPSNRRHAEIVQEWFEDSVNYLMPDGLLALGGGAAKSTSSESAADLVNGPKWGQLMQACGTGMASLIQQAGVHCYERGASMAEVWNCYTALNDLRSELMEENVQDLEMQLRQETAKAVKLQADHLAQQSVKDELERLRTQNNEMRSRIATIEGERDEYMKRMVDLEDSVARSDLRASRLQMYKNFTLKKFVDVASEKVATRTEEVEILCREMKERRFRQEGMSRKVNLLHNHVQDAVKLTDMLPPANQIRAVVVSAAEASDECVELNSDLEKIPQDVVQILEGGEDPNDMLASQGLDSESFFELVKSTVALFQLDLDPNVVFDNFHTPAAPNASADDRNSARPPAPRRSSSHGSAPGEHSISDHEVQHADSMDMGQSKDMHPKPSSGRVNFGGMPSLVYPPNMAPPTAASIEVDVADLIDAEPSDMLKEVARLRRHLMEMERQGTPRSARESMQRARDDNASRPMRMMSLASMKSLIARSQATESDDESGWGELDPAEDGQQPAPVEDLGAAEGLAEMSVSVAGSSRQDAD